MPQCAWIIFEHFREQLLSAQTSAFVLADDLSEETFGQVGAVVVSRAFRQERSRRTHQLFYEGSRTRRCRDDCLWVCSEPQAQHRLVVRLSRIFPSADFIHPQLLVLLAAQSFRFFG